MTPVSDEEDMSERSGVNILTFLLVIGLLVAAVLGLWWFEKRFEAFESRLVELERLDPKLERLGRELKGELSGLQDLTERMDALQKTTAPLARVDRSLDLLSEKVGGEIAPAVARISEVAQGVANAEAQLKALSEGLAATQQRIAEQSGVTVGTLKSHQQEWFTKLEPRLSAVVEAQGKLSTELTGLQTRLKEMSDAQGKLSGLTGELKTLRSELGALSKSVESLKNQLQDIDKKLPKPKTPGPAA